ncbi:MAG: hypothetical protein KIT10_13715 [Flavobacteriales bacterium]|nr:hypothetical protein [Flavobacteriales bacterium]
MTRSLLLLFACATGMAVMAQDGSRPQAPKLDRILLMNGQIIDARVVGQSTLEVRYLEETRRGRKERAEPTESVFSVTDTLGRERIWYFFDTVFGNDLTVEQMRWFIKGEQDARRGYKPLWPMLGGFLTGAGVTIALDLEVNSLLIPPVYAGAMAFPRVHVTKGSISDPLMEGDEFYAYGYAKVGRSKRVVRSLIATAAGVATGLFVRQVLINPNLSER